MNFCVTGNSVRNCIAHVRQKEGWRRERSYVVEKIHMNWMCLGLVVCLVVIVVFI